VVLDISRRLAEHIDAMPGYRAVLVRDGDYYVALRDRIRMAREQRADLFISVHADAFKSPSVSGASVYTLSNPGPPAKPRAGWRRRKTAPT
jgi:N-acetylmuramoyl-L-alanine amidase